MATIVKVSDAKLKSKINPTGTPRRSSSATLSEIQQIVLLPEICDLENVTVKGTQH